MSDIVSPKIHVVSTKLQAGSNKAIKLAPSSYTQPQVAREEEKLKRAAGSCWGYEKLKEKTSDAQ